MEIIETDREKPLCPHCEKAVSKIKATRIRAKLRDKFR